MCDKEEIEKSVDVVSEQEREYAQNALADFNKENYAGCLQNINKLENRTFDVKVAHNKAVVEFYKGDLKKIESFQKNLNTVFHQFNMRLDKLDDVDHCVAYFNQAVLMYHQKHYTSALRTVERVYKFIEPMDESLARQVGLLAVELQLCAREPEKALSLISYLENHIVHGQSTTLKTTLKNSKQNEKEVKEKKAPSPISPANEIFLKKLNKFKIKCNLMNHNLELAGTDISSYLNQDKQNVELLFLSANLEYLKGNYEESIKILTSLPNDCLKYNETGDSSTVLFYNNMGVIHHALGKPNMACHYFQKALKEDIALNANFKNSEKTLYTVGGFRYHEIMYNLGIALLYAGRPVQAFDCLLIALRRYHRNSRLWLRIAECCIKAHKNSNEIDFDLDKKHKIIVDIIGTQENQRMVMTNSVSHEKKYSTEPQTYAVPVATLEFASLCLRNAYLLLPTDTISSPVPLLLIPGVTPPAPPPNPGPAPSNSLTPDGIIELRNTILASSAYVALCLGDYILALEHAQNLLSQPRISGCHKFLGNLYAAEALVLLDKLSDALDHLNPEKVKEITFQLPKEETEMPFKTYPPTKWFPDSTSNAIAIMQYNIAVVKAIRGQLNQAATLLKQLWQMKGPDCRVPAHVIMLFVYVELKLGHADNAKALIKQYSLHQRISG